MSGEWIPIDACLPTKPEVLELVETTGLGVDQIVGRLVQFWGWAALNASDGQCRITASRLSRQFGGDEAFWYAVAHVGWLVFDADAGTVAIPGWDRRFSQAAKSRSLHAVRAASSRETEPVRSSARARAPKRTQPCAEAHAPVRSGALERGEEIEEKRNSSSSTGDVCADPEGAWRSLRLCWNAGPGRPWGPQEPPAKLAERLAEPDWLTQSLAAIPKLGKCRYFQTPVTLLQFVGPGFVERVLGGQYDDPRPTSGSTRGRPDDRPPPVAWVGDDAARFEATKRALAEKIRAS
jgi:hypothetical protein